jgi:hypothetical protein
MRRFSLVPCLLLALAACDGPSQPPAAAPAATPAATPATPAKPEPATPPASETPAQPPTSATPTQPAGVVIEPKPPTKIAAPVDKPAADGTVTCTPEKRKGGMCTREMRPVCGSYADKTTKKFPNPCVACSDEKIVSYVEGDCAAAAK